MKPMLTEKEKYHKLSNLLQKLRAARIIVNLGSTIKPNWSLIK